MKRKTVNLSDRDVERLAAFLEEGSPAQRALAATVGEDPVPYSDSAALRALAIAGADAVRARLLEQGYEELARTYTDDDTALAEASLGLAGEAWTGEASS